MKLSFLFPVLIVAAVLGLYVPTLSYDLQWDDKLMLVDSVTLSGPDAFKAALTRPYLWVINDIDLTQNYYRPVSLLLLALERRAFGTDPLGYRLIHSAFHLTNCLFVYFLLALFLQRSAEIKPDLVSKTTNVAAGLGALFFAVAPHGVDTVLLLSNVGDELVLAFMSICILSGLSYAKKGRILHLLITLPAALLGAFSKETGACVPIVLALAVVFSGIDIRLKRSIIIIGSTALIVLAMIIVRSLLLQDFTTSTNLPMAISGLGMALRFSIWPHPLALAEEVPVSLLNPWFFLGAIFSVSFPFVWLRQRARCKLALLGASFWFVTLLPSLAAVGLSGIFSARYLYIPGLGTAAIVAAAVRASKKRTAYIVSVSIIAAWCLFAVMRVVAWHDAYSLWAREVELNPSRPGAINNLAVALEKKGEKMRSEEAFIQAGEIAKAKGVTMVEAIARTQACRLRLLRNDRDGALQQCVLAIKAYPNHSPAWLALGNIHAADGNWENAYQSFKEAVDRNPNVYKALLSLAGAEAAIGKYDDALLHLERARALSRGDAAKQIEVLRKMEIVAGRKSGMTR